MTSTRDQLIERAVRAFGIAPSKLLGRPVAFDGGRLGVITGWRCTAGPSTRFPDLAGGPALTVTTPDGLDHDVHTEAIEIVGG